MFSYSCSNHGIMYESMLLEYVITPIIKARNIFISVKFKVKLLLLLSINGNIYSSKEFIISNCLKGW